MTINTTPRRKSISSERRTGEFINDNSVFCSTAIRKNCRHERVKDWLLLRMQ
jgi:hypothetical protein